MIVWHEITKPWPRNRPVLVFRPKYPTGSILRMQLLPGNLVSQGAGEITHWAEQNEPGPEQPDKQTFSQEDAEALANLARFLADTWSDIDSFVRKYVISAGLEASVHYPVIQGTRNQLNLEKIARQPYQQKRVRAGVDILLSNEPGTEKSDIKEALVAWHKMRRSKATLDPGAAVTHDVLPDDDDPGN